MPIPYMIKNNNGLDSRKIYYLYEDNKYYSLVELMEKEDIKCTGIKIDSLRQRLHKCDTWKEVKRKKCGGRPRNTYEYQGKKYTVQQLLTLSNNPNLTYTQLKGRLSYMSVEEALTKPVRQCKSHGSFGKEYIEQFKDTIIVYKGKEYVGLSDLLLEFGVTDYENQICTKLSKGMSLEDLIPYYVEKVSKNIDKLINAPINCNKRFLHNCKYLSVHGIDTQEKYKEYIYKERKRIFGRTKKQLFEDILQLDIDKCREYKLKELKEVT